MGWTREAGAASPPLRRRGNGLAREHEVEGLGLVDVDVDVDRLLAVLAALQQQAADLELGALGGAAAPLEAEEVLGVLPDEQPGGLGADAVETLQARVVRRLGA